MVTSRVIPYDYQSGGSYGICFVCGFKDRLNKMRLRWDGARVCEADWDPRPDTMNPPNIFPEGLPRPDAAPEPPDSFIAAQVLASDL